MEIHTFKIEYPNGNGGFDRYQVTPTEVSECWFQTNGTPSRFYFRFVRAVWKDCVELDRDAWLRSLGVEPMAYDDVNSFNFPELPLLPGSLVLVNDDVSTVKHYQQLAARVGAFDDCNLLRKGAPAFLLVENKSTPEDFHKADKYEAAIIKTDKFVNMFNTGVCPVEKNIQILPC